MAKQILEHPQDWDMQEGDLSKSLSRLAYRCISLSDRTRTRKGLSDTESKLLAHLSQHLTALGG